MLNLKIKELRNQHGLTQSELAKKMNVSQQTIGSWEVGRAEPNSDALNKLADLFDVTTDYLLGRNQTPDWANEDDLVELDKLLESNVNMAYGGETLTPEEKQRVKDVMTGLFWEFRKRDKEK
ncbi:helix-turn-helix domain-containing protein [Enterococcus thailandicus]|uniref:helix-turn-helix transcriptional regulator n=1 Tax=Enterococcus thailandicus TaxID=417368 RepID=UPI0022EBE191|nr:helix-turn-helix domain-containing protein [Enterococcus thailandicus]MDA3973254.1 helix-turn-helix domain-containing protein [Enterococcus thailandicus]MDA3976160.1 helix-turn-helix domain-containing protein [Enterococcus thailandicus]MDA3980714.1 helix-turn-helix domain-containing protein [Enterococcus thailandicus]